MSTPPTAKPGRQRLPPVRSVVESVERVTPLVVRVAVRSEALAAYGEAKPGGHTKLFFPPGEWPPAAAPEAAPRPPSRTFTPRRFDARASRLEIEFVLHGAGLAANFAKRAKAGDTLWVAAQPGGGYEVPPATSQLVIVADDTSLPAAGTILEALPAHCRVQALCEVATRDEERALSPGFAGSPTWLHRAPQSSRPGALLEAAVAALPALPDDVSFWIACEAGAMRRIRDFLLRERNVDRSRLHTRGYWKFGDTNYPDHDYGKD